MYNPIDQKQLCNLCECLSMLQAHTSSVMYLFCIAMILTIAGYGAQLLASCAYLLSFGVITSRLTLTSHSTLMSFTGCPTEAVSQALDEDSGSILYHPLISAPNPPAVTMPPDLMCRYRVWSTTLRQACKQ